MTKIENIGRIANDMNSSELIHPGEMIKDEIAARGLTQKELAQQMGVTQRGQTLLCPFVSLGISYDSFAEACKF